MLPPAVSKTKLAYLAAHSIFSWIINKQQTENNGQKHTNYGFLVESFGFELCFFLLLLFDFSLKCIVLY